VDDITSREAAKHFKWVGTRPVRPDGVPKVTGLALYGADLAMPGMLVGRILRSPHARACIHSIDTSKAAALPGVKAVVTSADFPEQKFEYVGPERVAQNFWHMTRNIMAREKALYEGHAVAAVAATSKAIADEALSLIVVDYEVLPHVIDVDEAMKPDAPLLFPDLITRGSSRRRNPLTFRNGSNTSSAILRLVSRRPTRSLRCRSRPRPCIRPISSRKAASHAATPTGRPNSGARARGTSLSAPTPRSCLE
jgi:CO/xanthine dehydrogenase Mo-binding subunit